MCRLEKKERSFIKLVESLVFIKSKRINCLSNRFQELHSSNYLEATVHVSSALVKGLCAVTNEIANGLKPHFQSILPSNPDEESNTVTDGVMLIATTSMNSKLLGLYR